MVRQRSDNALHAEVRSRSRAGLWHQVVLDHYRDNGSCECEHFEIRLKPRLMRGEMPSDELRCEHIKEAREALLESTIARLRRENPSDIPAA